VADLMLFEIYQGSVFWTRKGQQWHFSAATGCTGATRWRDV